MSEQRWEREQREWESEHLSDDEWAKRYSPDGAAAAFVFLAVGLVGIALIAFLVVKLT